MERQGVQQEQGPTMSMLLVQLRWCCLLQGAFLMKFNSAAASPYNGISPRCSVEKETCPRLLLLCLA